MSKQTSITEFKTEEIRTCCGLYDYDADVILHPGEVLMAWDNNSLWCKADLNVFNKCRRGLLRNLQFLYRMLNYGMLLFRKGFAVRKDWGEVVYIHSLKDDIPEDVVVKNLSMLKGRFAVDFGLVVEVETEVGEAVKAFLGRYDHLGYVDKLVVERASEINFLWP
jgi:hypothetical protein